MIGTVRAAIRMASTAVVLFTGTVTILFTSWLPIKRQGIRLAAWNMCWMSRAFIRIFKLQIEYPDTSVFFEHHGFVFPNHLSYLDIVVLLNIIPMRFLAKEEVRSFPFIGQVAQAVGTVFVKREQKSSRSAARSQLANVPRYPPIVIFPEGKIGPGKTLLPFRHGAFEIAAQGSSPFLPCALLYEPEALVVWGDEPLLDAVWRLARWNKEVKVRLVVLPAVSTQPSDNAPQLAVQAHEAILKQLGYAEPEEGNKKDDADGTE